jgi:hypothetical protein
VAACPICKGEMTHEISCSSDPFVINDRTYEPVRWGDQRRFGQAGAASAWKDCRTPPKESITTAVTSRSVPRVIPDAGNGVRFTPADGVMIATLETGDAAGAVPDRMDTSE